MHRRRFVKNSAWLLAASVCLPKRPAWASSAPKKVLVLGGTSFLGPAVVDAFVAVGHTVTLFNRGVTNPDLFPHLEKLRGFRSPDANTQDLTPLSHRRFDIIVDVWPNDPAVVASAAEFLKDRTQNYLFVSSVAAYDSHEFAKAAIVEDVPMEPWSGSGRPYNRNKAESERRLHQIIGERLTIVRPGPIKGTRDSTPDLLTWLLRAQLGGEHIAPGDGHDPVELVDVKDVASFLALAVERLLYGTFNLTGRSMSFREFLKACQSATRSDATSHGSRRSSCTNTAWSPTSSFTPSPATSPSGGLIPPTRDCTASAVKKRSKPVGERAPSKRPPSIAYTTSIPRKMSTARTSFQRQKRKRSWRPGPIRRQLRNSSTCPPRWSKAQLVWSSATTAIAVVDPLALFGGCLS
jgi:2'-hydroxyisoflavone reductase